MSIKTISNFSTANTELKALYDEFNLMYFGGQCPSNLPVEWNKRLTSAAGRASYRRNTLTGEMSPKILCMSWSIFKRMNFEWSELEDTIIHEMAHIWAIEVHNYAGHGGVWHEKMCQIYGKKTQKEFQYHNFLLRYGVRCNDCGNIVQKASRKPQSGKFMHSRSRCCRGSLSLWDYDLQKCHWAWGKITYDQRRVA